MHKSLVPLLGALKPGPMGFGDICNRVQSAGQTDTVNRLFALVRMNWVSEDNGVYSLTTEGSKQLEAVEPPVEDIPKLRAMELGRRPDEPSQTSSSAPVPLLYFREHKHTVALTEKEKRLFASLPPGPQPLPW